MIWNTIIYLFLLYFLVWFTLLLTAPVTIYIRSHVWPHLTIVERELVPWNQGGTKFYSTNVQTVPSLLSKTMDLLKYTCCWLQLVHFYLLSYSCYSYCLQLGYFYTSGSLITLEYGFSLGCNWTGFWLCQNIK